MEASCAASGVRNSCEMLASTESRARRTASSSVSSRITCTCRPSTCAALVMTVVRSSPAAAPSCSMALALPALRAATIGQRPSQGRRPSSALRLEHVAAEAPDRLLRGDAEELLRPGGSGSG